MKEIRLKQLVDEKQLDLHKLSEESVLPYATLENWYNTSKFDGDQVGVHELTNLAAALDVEVTELVDLSNS